MSAMPSCTSPRWVDPRRKPGESRRRATPLTSSRRSPESHAAMHPPEAILRPPRAEFQSYWKPPTHLRSPPMRSARFAPSIVIAMTLAVLSAAYASEETKPAEPEEGGTHGLVECEMEFNLSGWSAIYATSKGTGTIKCNTGQSAKVTIRSKGGGITFGKSE